VTPSHVDIIAVIIIIIIIIIIIVILTSTIQAYLATCEMLWLVEYSSKDEYSSQDVQTVH